MAPGREARKVGFQISAAEHPIGQHLVVQQQHAAIPYRRLLPLQRGEIGINFGPPLLRERPRLRREGEIEPVDVNEENAGTHTAGSNFSASNTRLGATISSCAAIS